MLEIDPKGTETQVWTFGVGIMASLPPTPKLISHLSQLLLLRVRIRLHQSNQLALFFDNRARLQFQKIVFISKISILISIWFWVRGVLLMRDCCVEIHAMEGGMDVGVLTSACAITWANSCQPSEIGAAPFGYSVHCRTIILCNTWCMGVFVRGGQIVQLSGLLLLNSSRMHTNIHSYRSMPFRDEMRACQQIITIIIKWIHPMALSLSVSRNII